MKIIGKLFWGFEEFLDFYWSDKVHGGFLIFDF